MGNLKGCDYCVLISGSLPVESLLDEEAELGVDYELIRQRRRDESLLMECKALLAIKVSSFIT